MPNAEQSEREVLSALMFDPDCIPTVRRVVKADDFSDRNHGAIYASAVALYDHGHHPDTVMIVNHLRSNGHEAVEPLVTELADEGFTAANVTYHAKVVRDAARRRDLIRAMNVAIAAALDGKTPIASIAQTTQEAILPMAVTENNGVGFKKPDYVRVAMEIEARGQRALPGLSSGFREIDQHTHGFRPSEFVVIGGTPKLGKTTVATTIGQKVARSGVGVLICSAEMTADQLTERLLNSHASVSIDATSTGRLTDSEGQRLVQSVRALSTDCLYIDDEPTPNLSDLTARCVAQKAAHPEVQLIIVDFLQLIRHRMSGRRGDEELDAIAYGLKALAKRTGCVVIAPTQLNHREADSRSDPRPVLRDISGSSGILKAADFVALAYRPAIHNPAAPPNLLELHFAASRRTPTFTANLTWDGAHARVLDRAS